MAIPQYKLDEILMNAFSKAFKIGGLYKATETIWDDETPWIREPFIKKDRFYILLKAKPSYSYEAYCKMCWDGADSFIPLHFHITVLDGDNYKEVDASIYCGLPRSTSEISIFYKVRERLKSSGQFKSIEEKE